LSSTHFKQPFKELFPIGLLFILAFILIENLLGTNILSWHIIPILLLYPIWGVIQQFLVVGLVAKNLDTLEGVNIPRVGIILFTGYLAVMVFLSRSTIEATAVFGRIGYFFFQLRNEAPKSI